MQTFSSWLFAKYFSAERVWTTYRILDNLVTISQLGFPNETCYSNDDQHILVFKTRPDAWVHRFRDHCAEHFEKGKSLRKKSAQHVVIP